MDIHNKPGSRSQNFHYKPDVVLNIRNAMVENKAQESGPLGEKPERPIPAA